MHALLLKDKDTENKDPGESSGNFAHKQCNHWHTEQRKRNILEQRAFKIISKNFILLPLKGGGKRRWIKQQIHQLTTMQKTSIEEFIHRLHTANQERITSPEVSKTSQSASIRCSERPIKKGWQPSQSNTHHTEKKRNGRAREQKRNDRV